MLMLPVVRYWKAVAGIPYTWYDFGRVKAAKPCLMAYGTLLIRCDRSGLIRVFPEATISAILPRSRSSHCSLTAGGFSPLRGRALGLSRQRRLARGRAGLALQSYLSGPGTPP